VVSDDLKGYFVRDLGIDASAIRTIRNGVDLRKFFPGPKTERLRKLLPPSRNGPIAMTVGRLSAPKDHANLLAAQKILADREGRPSWSSWGMESSVHRSRRRSTGWASRGR